MYKSHAITTHTYQLKFHHLNYKESVNMFILRHVLLWKFLKHCLVCALQEIKHSVCGLGANKALSICAYQHLGHMLRALFHIKHSRKCLNMDTAKELAGYALTVLKVLPRLIHFTIHDVICSFISSKKIMDNILCKCVTKKVYFSQINLDMPSLFLVYNMFFTPYHIILKFLVLYGEYSTLFSFMLPCKIL